MSIIFLKIFCFSLIFAPMALPSTQSLISIFAIRNSQSCLHPASCILHLTTVQIVQVVQTVETVQVVQTVETVQVVEIVKIVTAVHSDRSHE